MKVAILGGYGPSQSVGAVFRAFARAGHEVFHWPTFPKFDVDCYPQSPLPDLLFSFKIGLGNVPPGWISSLCIRHKIFWSFDDPHWIGLGKDLRWAREHDHVLTSCAASVGAYHTAGCRSAFFMPPAMDPEYYPPWTKTDQLISFICTNLYPLRDFPHNFIDRSEMIDRLTTTFGQDFALYGFNPTVEAKAACRGSLKWETTLPEVIRGTKLNIENHAYNNELLYFNERFFQVVATKRAMFLDRVHGFTDIFKDDEFVFYSSLDELVEKLIHYKDRDDELAAIGRRGFERMNGWTYDELVRQVVNLTEGKRPAPTFLV